MQKKNIFFSFILIIMYPTLIHTAQPAKRVHIHITQYSPVTVAYYKGYADAELNSAMLSAPTAAVAAETRRKLALLSVLYKDAQNQLATAQQTIDSLRAQLASREISSINAPIALATPTKRLPKMKQCKHCNKLIDSRSIANHIRRHHC